MLEPAVLVLSGVHSNTHLVYASSYVRHRLRTQPRPLHLLVLDTWLATEDIDRRRATMAAMLPVDERLTLSFASPQSSFADEVPTDSELLSIGAPATRALARLIAAHHGRLPRVVVVDEGIGSYGSWLTRRAAYLRQGDSEPRSTVRAATVASAARLVPGLRWSLYLRRRTGWEVNEEVAGEFRLRLQGGPPVQASAVILTQPWPDLGVISERAYAAQLDAVHHACAAAGLDLLVRPHPLEPRDRYARFHVLADEGPAELDRQVVGARVVLGANSTALLNVGAIHGTRVLRITAPEFARIDRGLGRRQRSLLDAYLPTAVMVDQLAGCLPVL